MLYSDRVKNRREELLLAQEDIAKFIGVSVDTVNNWEHGFSNPQKKNLQALAQALQTTTDYLEGKTEVAGNYLSGGNKCIICGKPIPYGVAKCPECCWRTWPASYLTSTAQATRRKRSHSVTLSYLDREKARATFTSVTSYGVNKYETSLDMCTCPDFEERRMPCKHIFRLAEELGLFQSETFAPGEDDYTMHFATVTAHTENNIQSDQASETVSAPSESVCEPPAVVESSAIVPEPVNAKPEKVPRKPGIFLRLLKYAVCCFLGFWAVMFILMAIEGDKPSMCFSVAFAIAGTLTAITAGRKGEKSVFMWWIYGALVPIVSWIEVSMLRSENRAKSFMSGVKYSLVGFVVFVIVFVQFLPTVKHEELPQPEVNEVPAVVIMSEDTKPAPKESDDSEAKAMALLADQGEWELEDPAEEERLERERKAELKREQEEYLKKANTVVVTPRGKKYHEPTCRTVRGSYKSLTVAQARKRGYTPCKVCNPPSKTVTLENSNIYWGDNVY